MSSKNRFIIGSIVQLTHTEVKQTTDYLGEVTRRAVDVEAALLESGIRAKLIELGWTPPSEKKGLARESDRRSQSRPVAPPPVEMAGGDTVQLPEPDMPVYDLRGTPVHAHSTDQLLAHREEYAAARVASVSRQWAEAIERSADDCAVLRQRAETADRERDEARAEAERLRAKLAEAEALVSRLGTPDQSLGTCADAAILADREAYTVAYPFTRCRASVFNGEGIVEVDSWKPGTEYGPLTDDFGDFYRCADGIGTMNIVEVGRYKPVGYPERVFFVRTFTTPDGHTFGKKRLRVEVASKFRRTVSGYAHEYVLLPTGKACGGIVPSVRSEL